MAVLSQTAPPAIQKDAIWPDRNYFNCIFRPWPAQTKPNQPVKNHSLNAARPISKMGKSCDGLYHTFTCFSEARMDHCPIHSFLIWTQFCCVYHNTPLCWWMFCNSVLLRVAWCTNSDVNTRPLQLYNYNCHRNSPFTQWDLRSQVCLEPPLMLHWAHRVPISSSSQSVCIQTTRYLLSLLLLWLLVSPSQSLCSQPSQSRQMAAHPELASLQGFFPLKGSFFLCPRCQVFAHWGVLAVCK